MEGKVMQTYWLRHHIYSCSTTEGVYFLDLRKGKYFGLGAAQYEAVGPLVSGWASKAGENPDALETDLASAREFAEALVGRDILTTDKTLGKDAQPPDIQRRGTMPFRPETDRVPDMTLGHLSSLLFAVLSARVSLSFNSLERIVARVRSRRERLAMRILSEPRIDIYELAWNFRRHRGLFYTPKNHCLFDSIVLAEFLARFGWTPDWVLGVQPRPFGAHSWVQHEGFVLNDTLERVENYYPILVA
jgi:hypothetical protein